jgi:hypothetical protein
MLRWARSSLKNMGGQREEYDAARRLSPMWIKWFKRNGHMHTGKQNPRCKVCGRAFVLTPEKCVIIAAQRTLIERLLLERISLRGICRAVGVGLQWLWQFMVTRCQAAPDDLYAKSAGGSPTVIVQRLEAEVDEPWGLVGKKAHRQWGWIAMDASPHQVFALHVGDRSARQTHYNPCKKEELGERRGAQFSWRWKEVPCPP